MAKKLFVGGISYNAKSADLNELFSKFGNILSCDIIIDKFSGQSKGFGFIEFENDKDADEAVSKLHDTDFMGRKITVNVAKPREERPAFEHRGGYQRDNRGSNRGGYNR